MKLHVKVDSEFASEIVVENLKSDWRMQNDEIKRLVAIENRQAFQQEDLECCKRVRDACEVLLQYYLIIDEYNAFIDQEFINDVSITEEDIGYPRS